MRQDSPPWPGFTSSSSPELLLAALVVPALLRGVGDPVEATPGAHAGLARAGDAPVPFACSVKAGYDPRRPAPLVVLLHGAGPKRRYLGGISRGVFGAFHAVARAAQAPAGFLGIAGVLDEADAAAVERRLRGKGVYLVIGSRDEAFGTAPVRANLRTLRSAGVRAR